MDLKILEDRWRQFIQKKSKISISEIKISEINILSKKERERWMKAMEELSKSKKENEKK
jgi:hypothetical protein